MTLEPAHSIIAAFLLLPALIEACLQGRRGGREGYGFGRTWQATWILITRKTTLYLCVLLLLIAVAAGAANPEFLDHVGWLILVPIIAAFALIPITAFGVFLGYNFGARHRASEELSRSQAAAQIMAEAIQESSHPSKNPPGRP